MISPAELGRHRWVSLAFYEGALAAFRRRLAGEALFVVVSDDPQWCEAQPLFHASDVTVTRFAPRDSPLHDLALLAACDHNVVSLGTFGWWGAWLAGGQVLYHQEFEPNHRINVDGKAVPADYYPRQWIDADANTSRF